MCCYATALSAGLHSGNVGRAGREWGPGVDSRIFQGREGGWKEREEGEREIKKEGKNEGEEEEGKEE